MKLKLSTAESILTDGFAVIPSVISHVEAADLIASFEKLGQEDAVRRRGGVFAVRNLLNISPEALALASSRIIRDLVAPILGETLFPVRGILFDKTPDANWKVPWHQDVTIAVEERIDFEGFGPWSTKAGVPHVQPPASVLEGMLSVRVHLDPCGETNGALKVIPGSHLLGRIAETEASALGGAGPVEVCSAQVGDALLMRPLLLHASSSSNNPSHRRVLHFDFASASLPGGLRWSSQ